MAIERSAAVTIFATGFFFAHACYAQFYNVAEYGALGNKSANDGPAIQRAIDACAAAGGGMVYVPAGDYLSGQLRLKSHVTLRIEAGATLRVSPKKEHYERGNRFLYAEGETNITLEGRGTIHGTGEEDLQRKRGDDRPRPAFRVGILEFVRCNNISIRDITVRYSDSWTFDLEFCENIVISGVNILNNYYRVNADGIDPVSCKNVHISDCHIIAGDDPIVCKSREGHPCEDVVVTNCTLETVATAVKIGTESHEAFRNIRVSNCVIRNSGVGIGIYIKDGATAERVSFTNCVIETIRQPDLIGESTANTTFPIFIDIEKRHPDSRIGRIRDVTFSDIDILSDRGILIQGMSTRPIENLTLRNINVRIDRACDYSQRKKRVGGSTSNTEDRRSTIYARQPSYATLANVNGLTIDGLRVTIADEAFSRYKRSALSLHHVTQAMLSHVARIPASVGANMPVVVMEDCRNVLLTQCFALPGTGVFVGIEGENTANISLVGNDLELAEKVATIDDNVPAGAVRD